MVASACSLEAIMRVTNGIPLGRMSTFLTGSTCKTLKVLARTTGKINIKLTGANNRFGNVAFTCGCVTGGPHEEAVEVMVDAYSKTLSDEERSTLLVYLDKPWAEGPFFRQHLDLWGSYPRYRVKLTDTKLVHTAEECAAACKVLRDTGGPLALDTENRWDKMNKNNTSLKAATLQLHAKGTAVYIFQFTQFAKEPSGQAKLYESLSLILTDKQCELVVHSAGKDRSNLCNRFPILTGKLEHMVELKTKLPNVLSARLSKDKCNNQLSTYCRVGLGKTLNKDIDHNNWENAVLTEKEIEYCAADSQVMTDIMSITALPAAVHVDDFLQPEQDTAEADAVAAAAAALNVSVSDADASNGEDEREGEGMGDDAANHTGEVDVTAFESLGLNNAAQTSLVMRSLLLIQQFAAERGPARRKQLRLPQGITRECRRLLHQICKNDLDLNTYTVGPASVDSAEVVFVVERSDTPFTIVTPQQGYRAVGYLVENPAGDRGVVTAYVPPNRDAEADSDVWLVEYDEMMQPNSDATADADLNRDILPRRKERLKLTDLNQQLAKRWQSDSTVPEAPIGSVADVGAASDGVWIETPNTTTQGPATFWYHTVTRETRWNKPPNPAANVPVPAAGAAAAQVGSGSVGFEKLRGDFIQGIRSDWNTGEWSQVRRAAYVRIKCI
jgi:hypothetical protein